MATTSKFKLTGAALVAFAVAACATPPTPYQPVNKRGFGFDSVKLEDGKYRVSFQGNTRTDLATVENYILLRAAELAIADGFGHFVILDENETGLSTFRSNGTTFGNGGFGRFGGFRGGFGGGFATTSSTTRERTSYEVDVIVQAFEGEKDPQDLDAFNAVALIANLAPIVIRPS